jgi:hypothetical protein
VSPELRERIHAQARESRRRQGLPEHITDPATLDWLAARVLEADQLQLTGTEDEPTTTAPDRRREGRWRAC